MTEAQSKIDGLLIVDMGHNSGTSGEAAYHWSTLNSVLGYHMIQACNLGVTFKGLLLMGEIHLIVSMPCMLPYMSKCECSATCGRRHAHRLSDQVQDNDHRNTVAAIRQAVIFACDYEKWSFVNGLAAKQLLKPIQSTMCDIFTRFLSSRLAEGRQNRKEIQP